MKRIDARGQNCPIPVMMAKKEIDGGEEVFQIRVDNQTAVENLIRLAESSGYQAKTEEEEGGFCLTFAKNGSAPAPAEEPEAPLPGKGGWSLFVPRDIIGEGDRELGTNLMRMYFYTLTQEKELPGSVLFMNAGVNLPVSDPQIVEHLKTLIEKGVEVLVCGTCLNFYGLGDRLQVGVVSNMYDIMRRMQSAQKVITL